MYKTLFACAFFSHSACHARRVRTTSGKLKSDQSEADQELTSLSDGSFSDRFRTTRDKLSPLSTLLSFVEAPVRRPLNLRLAPSIPNILRLSANRPSRDDQVDALWNAAAPERTANTEDPSHMHIELDKNGQPVKPRFVYVDEVSCIGCTFCASVARNTFFMEEEYGRARVYDQESDSDDMIAEAIDCCPVNCINYVSYEDLLALEKDRTRYAMGGEKTINNAARLVGGDAGTAPQQLVTLGRGTRCNNCPGRGCKDCPMFGVGQNPIYLERLAERENKRKKSGEAKREEERKERADLIDKLMAAPYMDSIESTLGDMEMSDNPFMVDADMSLEGDQLIEALYMSDDAAADDGVDLTLPDITADDNLNT